MPIDILMPALSPTMEKGNLAKWLKHEGDAVRTGDVLAEIETDKATMEYEAIEDGTLARILVPAGTQDVPVNAPIAVLARDGESVSAAAAGASPASAPASASASKTPAAPAHEAPAQPTTGVTPTMQASVQTHAASSGNGARVFASPLARRLARDAGIEIGRIGGSGPHGRVIARDVEAAVKGGGLRTPPASAGASPAATAATAPTASPPPPPAAPSDAAVRALYPDGSYEFVPHDQMRRIIAQRLQVAKQTIPHFYLTVTCTIDTLLAAREAVNAAAPKGADGKPAYKLSVNDFVIKALALALMKVPDANVTWTDGGMLKHSRADVAVAVAIPGGLITPVIRNAEAKSLSVISAEMKDYAARARTRRLKPEEYQGGSTAISNLGMYGIDEFAAVINPPHATILAVGTAAQEPVVTHGTIGIATRMKLTLSTDHRAVDGALGSEFISAIKGYLENPVMMVV